MSVTPANIKVEPKRDDKGINTPPRTKGDSDYERARAAAFGTKKRGF